MGWGLGLEGEDLDFSQAFFFLYLCPTQGSDSWERESICPVLVLMVTPPDKGVTSSLSGSPCNGGWEVLERKFEALLLYT